MTWITPRGDRFTRTARGKALGQGIATQGFTHMHQPPSPPEQVLRLGHAPLTWQELIRRTRTPVRVDIDPDAAGRVITAW